jgi:hypothetical protein
MKCQITGFIGTLNASAWLPTDITYQFPTGFRDSIDAFDGFHENVICDVRFRDPEGAEEVAPVTVDSLLQCTTFVWTENALWKIAGGNMTYTTKPLTFRDIRNSITFYRLTKAPSF